jgi:ATP-dependent DNA helicase UvrD/PcrA
MAEHRYSSAAQVAPEPGIGARDRAGIGPAYLGGLNPEQRAAVELLDGPLLVLAGAGTGKTRVLTTRIAHILTLGRARPYEILAVTFTNRAAREMKERIASLLGRAVEGMPWLGTFHAIGVKILRRHAELVGLKPDFTILDTDDQIRLIKQVLEAANIDEKRWPARYLAGLIDHWKNRGLTPDRVPAGEAMSFANGEAIKLYAAYQDRLKVLNGADFGDLLLESIRLLRDNPSVLRIYQDRFRYILVDEYQDTNVAQYLWLRLVAQGSKNICCVGDDDQSIYGWRGAEVDNILRFEKDFSGAKVIRLERNYRSTGHILAAASHLIAHNEGRLGKTLRTERDLGDKVTVIGAWDSEEEARSTGEEIEALQRRGHKLDEIAILVRASFQMREFEDRFVTLGLPYRVIGGPRFYERAEIRDALAYMRCVASPSDDLAFERIVNVPKRGLGDATVKLLHEHARAHRVSLMESARTMAGTEELKARPRAALRELVAAFDRWHAARDRVHHVKLAETVLDESGYTGMWQQERSVEAAGRLENLKELVRSMEEFENLSGFLEHVSLVMDADGGPGADAVSIMTLHSAKGLEFDTVFLPGWEEGLFPHQRALDEEGRAGLEEERRLAHVGMTRARRRLTILFAGHRRIRGIWQATIPSRFLNELPPDDVEATQSSGTWTSSRFDLMEPFASEYETPGWRRARERMQSDVSGEDHSGNGNRTSRGRRNVMDGELVARSTGPSSPYAAGERVFHLKFGYGRVLSVEGNKLVVAFEKAGTKRVVDSFVERV